MNIVSVILARGGSKGIPNKNIIDLNGHPLIYYTIKASQKSEVHDTWVSTDSSKIKKIAESYGAKVLDRPSEYALDASSSEEALLHFADNIDFDIIVFIQPTSPLLTSLDINQGLDLMLSNEYNSICSVYEEHWVPRWTESMAPYNWDINNRPRRQDMPKLFVENGAFYITKKEDLLNYKLRYSGKIGYVQMKQESSFQIDTLDDLELIKKLL